MLQPVAVQLPELASETRLQRSVAERTEEQAVPGVEITYFALLHGEEGQLPDVVSSWRRKESNMQWTRAELSGSQRLEKSFRESPKRPANCMARKARKGSSEKALLTCLSFLPFRSSSPLK